MQERNKEHPRQLQIHPHPRQSPAGLQRRASSAGLESVSSVSRYSTEEGRRGQSIRVSGLHPHLYPLPADPASPPIQFNGLIWAAVTFKYRLDVAGTQTSCLSTRQGTSGAQELKAGLSHTGRPCLSNNNKRNKLYKERHGHLLPVVIMWT